MIFGTQNRLGKYRLIGVKTLTILDLIVFEISFKLGFFFEFELVLRAAALKLRVVAFLCYFSFALQFAVYHIASSSILTLSSSSPYCSYAFCPNLLVLLFHQLFKFVPLIVSILEGNWPNCILVLFGKGVESCWIEVAKFSIAILLQLCVSIRRMPDCFFIYFNFEFQFTIL